MRKTILILLMFASCIVEAADRWTLLGPQAGAVEQIVPDRSDPSVWYAINTGRLYRSRDGGRNWWATSLIDVRQVVVTPGNSELLAVTGDNSQSRIWESRDEGRTFTLRASLSFGLRKVIVSPDNPDAMFGFGLNDWDLAVSANGGRRWENVTTLPFVIGKEYDGGRMDNYEFEDLSYSPFHSNTVYASAAAYISYFGETDVRFLFLASYNSGRSWKVLSETQTMQFHKDPLYPDRLFAFNSESVRMLTKDGWETVHSLQGSKDPGGYFFQMASVPRIANELFALRSSIYRGDPSVVRSRDLGRTWEPVAVDIKGSLISLAALDDPTGGLLGGTDGGGLYYRNEQHGWISASSGFLEAQADVLATSGARVYVSPGSFLYRTDSPAPQWQNLSFHLPVPVIGLAADPVDPNHLVFSSRSSVWMSRDGGSTWQKAAIQSRSCCNFQQVAFDPTRPDIVYVTQWNVLHKSEDGGRTFRQMSAELPDEITDLLVDSTDGSLFLHVGFFGIFKSTDGGNTASLSSVGITPPCAGCDSVPVEDMAPLAVRGSYVALVYAENGSTLYRTVNGGNRWIRGASVPAIGGTRIVSVDGSAKHLLVVAGYGDALLETTDGGATWKNITAELGKDMEFLSFASAGGSTLVGTNHGIFLLH